MRQRTVFYSIFFALLLTSCSGVSGTLDGGAPQMVGGYTHADVQSDEIKRAAKEAIALRANTTSQKIVLVQIIEAKTQIVAGVNYALTLKVKVGTKVQTVQCTLWHQAWNKATPYQLTEWKILG